ncbi:hypothetical protein ACT43X_18695 (plasmid) [Acinetobacter baumannii]
MNSPVFIGVAIAIISASIASYLSEFNSFHINVIATALYLLSLAILCNFTKNSLSEYFGDAVVYAVIGMFFVMSFFPILNHFALSQSTAVMHEVTNWLGQKSHEVSPIAITVFWGAWYAKTLYVVIGGSVGYFIGKDD